MTRLGQRDRILDTMQLTVNRILEVVEALVASRDARVAVLRRSWLASEVAPWSARSDYRTGQGRDTPMNIIAGSTDRGRADALGATCSRLYGADLRAVGRLLLADEGVIIGVAEKGSVRTAVFGQVIDASLRHGGDLNRAAALILERYGSLGDRFIDGIDGHFLVIVDDARNDTVVVAVSPHSHSGVFVHRDPAGRITWSTALYLLATAVGAPVSRSWEDFMLLYGFYPFGHTPFEGVTEAKPGQCWTISEGSVSKGEVPDIDPWGGEYSDGLASADVDTAAARLEAAFMRALSEQAANLDRVAVLLGGFDSALVAAGLHKLGKEVETFTFRYESAEYNQPHTDTLSRHLDIRHHWVTIGAEDIASGLENYGLDFNTLTNWPNYVIQTRIVAERIRDAGFSHVFTGDGCDYLFFGYPLTFRRNQLISAGPRIPSTIHRPLVGLASRPSLDRRLGRPYQVGMGALRAWGRTQPTRSHLSFRVFDEVSLTNLRLGPPPAQERDVESVIEELAAPFAGHDPTRIAYLGKLFLAPYRIKMAGSSQATGASIMTPYLHRGIREVALSLPPELLRPRNGDESTKVIGKHALTVMADRQGLLPPEIIYQDKLAAVDAPLVDWYHGPLRATMLSLFRRLPFPADDTYLERLIEPKRPEALYARLISKDTSGVVTTSVGASLLATYASMTMPR
jgi:asparagine synthetase B (glutamine-hydrolysing)